MLCNYVYFKIIFSQLCYWTDVNGHRIRFPTKASKDENSIIYVSVKTHQAL